MLKLLRLWRERSIFDQSVLDPIDSFVSNIEKGIRSRPAEVVGDKRCVLVLLLDIHTTAVVIYYNDDDGRRMEILGTWSI